MGIGMSGMISGLDTDTIVQALVSGYSKKKTDYEKAQTKVEWKLDAWKSLNTKVYSFYSKSLSNLRFTSNYTKKTTSISDTSIAKISTTGQSVNGTQSLAVEQLAKSGYLTGARVEAHDEEGNAKDLKASSTLSELGITENTTITIGSGAKQTDIELTADMKVSDLVTKMKQAGVQASFDEANQRFFVSATESGKANDFTIKAATDSGNEALKSLGLYMPEGATEYENTDGAGAVRIYGQNAIIYLNGAKFENNDNTITVNGLSITATETTGKNDDGSLKTVSITTSDDTDAIYDMVRDFFSEYNELINEMDKLYNADSSKGYEPLTEDEKAEMTEDEIEKWETKIKDSLLKGDDTLASVSDALKNVMMRGFNVGGKTMRLSDLGIGTQSYFLAAENEKSAIHIDGDEEDEATSSKTDKLKNAIITDPDSVVDFFTQLSDALYSTLTEKMQATTLSSSYTLYNDKQMKSEYSQYTDRIADQEDKVAYWENYYYDQFSAMETALSRLNSQTSALTGLIGSGR